MTPRTPESYLKWTQGCSKHIDTIVKCINDTIYTVFFNDKNEISCNKIWEVYDDIINKLNIKDKIYIRKQKIIMCIVVELLENMKKHADISNQYQASLELREENHTNESIGNLVFETKNFGNLKDFQTLQWKIEKIKNMGSAKNAYKDEIRNGHISEKGGWGNGIFTIIKETQKRYNNTDQDNILKIDGENFNEEDLESQWTINIKVTIPNQDLIS